MKIKTQTMFPNGEDLPMFSGGLVVVREVAFAPTVEAQQASLLDLRPQFGATCKSTACPARNRAGEFRPLLRDLAPRRDRMVQSEVKAGSDNEGDRTMKHPTMEEIARSRQLWEQYVDPHDMDPGAFDRMTQAEKIAAQREMFPDETRQEDDEDDD